ncbi:PDZ domain-containing protein [Myxococcus sp. K15C18031901]|uniref:type II secretion system protein GspC n=1 Tax=Myxococcus dinghuensis TaxID=2906761 RepID=UPI0020A6FCFB|nr:type II secretion system protein GspC [Myxococcus dinghuensis]MCP3102777.1 PDZ domain-containing protein [Myxococcus dinghuensis]
MMRIFLQRYSWLLGCAFILAGAFVTAHAVQLLTEYQLAPPIPRGDALPGARARDAVAARPLPSSGSLSRLLGVSDRPATPGASAPALPRSGRRARLLGTLTARESLWSLASIQDLDTQRVHSIRVGDALRDAQVVLIERERVIIRVNGQEEVIDGQAPANAPAPPPPPSGREGHDIRRLGEHAYEIPGRFLDLERFAQTPELQQIRLVPAARDGKVQGFKLFAIRSGSPYEQAGFQNGDILLRVNGISLDSPQKALEVVTLFKNSRHLEVDVERAGAVLRKTYDVR